MKKIVLVLGFGVANCSFAVTGDGVQPRAIPSDTQSVTIKICNLANTSQFWDFSTMNSQAPAVINSSAFIDAGNCSLVGLRAQTDADMPEILVRVFNDAESSITSFKLHQFSAKKPSLNGSITKRVEATGFSGSSVKNLYTYQVASGGVWQSVPLLQNTKLKNLSGGVTPDYVFCFVANEREADKCNDGYGMR